jgi:putative ABC transport system ATP-binding protein
LLEAQHLSLDVGSKSLVKDANFSLKAGEVLAIVGPSGSGKTTLLRMLNRLDEPTSGTVFIEGKDYRDISPRELRRKIGMVMQRPFLFPGTVAQNISFGPKQRGELLGSESIQELLGQVGLPGYAERNVATLSGGEAQRVSVARTLANQPEVLLLDEPTSALDELSKAGVEALLQRIVREHQLTCVLVTHDTGQALRLAPRAIVMGAGRILRDGPTAEVLHA